MTSTPTTGPPILREACPHFHDAIELIGRRWNGMILHALLGGDERFCQIRGAIPEITDAMLSQRLRDLETSGLVVREVTAARPVEIRYRLTEIGRRLGPVLDAVSAWGHEWADQREASRRPVEADRP